MATATAKGQSVSDDNGAGKTCRFHEAHDSRLAQLEARDDKQDKQIQFIINELIDKVERRVPPWVAFAFGGCGTAIGVLVGILAMVIRGG